MGTKLHNAPVYFALAQVRFNPVLSLDTYLSGIQESFRTIGFPDFKKNVTATFNLAVMPPGGAPAQLQPPQSEFHYSFTDMDSKVGFVLGSNFLTLSTTEYDTFDTFSHTLMTGVEVIHKAISLSYVDRIGVRYLDAVFPRSNETLDQYLLPEVTGLSAKLGGVVVHSFSETRVQTKAGVLVARTIIQDGGIGFPPDFGPMALQVRDRFVKLQGPHATIDTDAFFEGREAFDLANVESRLNELHDEVSSAFKKAVTQHALKVWE